MYFTGHHMAAVQVYCNFVDTNVIFTEMENIFTLEDRKTSPSGYEDYSFQLRSGQRPIVLDNGSYECRLGWAGETEPRLVYRNLLAKTRREKGKESELLVGNDIVNIEVVRQALRSPFDRDVVTHFEAQEALLDYGFSHLGIDTECRVKYVLCSIAVCVTATMAA